MPARASRSPSSTAASTSLIRASTTRATRHQTRLGDPSLTNNKVIVAKVFNNKARKLGVDASDRNGHGTHVAGTIACNAHTPAVDRRRRHPV